MKLKLSEIFKFSKKPEKPTELEERVGGLETEVKLMTNFIDTVQSGLNNYYRRDVA